MGRVGKMVSWLIVIITPLLLYITASDLRGSEAEHKPRETMERQAHFILTVQGGLISLSAMGASVKEVLEDLGRRLDIDVSARLPADEKMTIAFEQLPVSEAIKRLGKYVNYVVLEDGAKEPGRIAKIIAFSKRHGSALGGSSTSAWEDLTTAEGSRNEVTEDEEPARAEPFQFQLNPSATRRQKR